MPPPGGKRASLAGLVAATARGAVAGFRDAFKPGALFSPGEPIAPPEPQQVHGWDYPVGWNYTYTPRSFEPIGFAELRALAETENITRLVIETRKDQIEQLSWSIRSRDANNPAADAEPRIAAMTALFEHPDGRQPFGSWLRELLEDILVIDAPTLEVRRTRGGQIIGLDIIDGATIKVLIDDTGRRPVPPAPAYEQVIHGVPWRLLTADEMIYAPRNRRPHKAYGYSPVEQIVMTINIALRRQVMQLQHFTEGNIPAGMINAPAEWTAEQIRQFQQWFDATLAGNTAERSKIMWGPAGAKYQAFKDSPIQNEFDEWLARIVCFAFSISPNAFIRHVQRTTADTLQEAALKEGLEPLKQGVKRLVDDVIQHYAGHADLEFAWDEEEALDPQSVSVILDRGVRNGLLTLNEGRAQLGFDPVAGGDESLIYLPTGPVTLLSVTAEPPPDESGDTAGGAPADGLAPASPAAGGAAGKAARSFPIGEGNPAGCTPARPGQGAQGRGGIAGAAAGLLRPPRARRRPPLAARLAAERGRHGTYP